MTGLQLKLKNLGLIETHKSGNRLTLVFAGHSTPKDGHHIVAVSQFEYFLSAHGPNPTVERHLDYVKQIDFEDCMKENTNV